HAEATPSQTISCPEHPEVWSGSGLTLNSALACTLCCPTDRLPPPGAPRRPCGPRAFFPAAHAGVAPGKGCIHRSAVIFLAHLPGDAHDLVRPRACVACRL